MKNTLTVIVPNTIKTTAEFQKWLSTSENLKWNSKYTGEFVQKNLELFRPDTTLRTAYWTPAIRATWDAVKTTRSTGTGTKSKASTEKLAKLAELINKLPDGADKTEALAILNELTPKPKANLLAKATEMFKTLEPGAEYKITPADLTNILDFMNQLQKMNVKLQAQNLKIIPDMKAATCKLVAIAA